MERLSGLRSKIVQNLDNLKHIYLFVHFLKQLKVNLIRILKLFLGTEFKSEQIIKKHCTESKILN